MSVDADDRDRPPAEPGAPPRRPRFPRVEILTDLARRAGTAEIDRLLAEACRSVADLLDVDHVAAYEHRPASGDLLLTEGAGWPASALGGFSLETLGPTQVAHTFRTWRATIVADTETEEGFHVPAVARELGVRSALTVPIPGSERAWGVLSAEADHPDAFGEHEALFLLAMAQLLGRAVPAQDLERRAE